MRPFQRNNFFLAESRFFWMFSLSIIPAIAQFFYNRGLWLDEVMLALNIVQRDFAQLLTPLDYVQVAPVLFLEIEKLLSVVVPFSEYGLRIFPLVAFILSTFFFIRLLKLIGFNENPYLKWFGVSLFALNPVVIYYSSEVKQYMCDVLVLTAMYYLLLRPYRREKIQFFILIAAGIIAIFLSNIAPVILFTSGIFLLYRCKRYRGMGLGEIVITGLVWVIFFGVYFYFFIYHHPSRESMLAYWTPHDAFFHINPFTKLFYKFLWDKWTMITTVLFQLGNVWRVMITILAIAGVFRLVRDRNVSWMILIILPVTLHILISSMRLYPFETRLILYACPLFVILCLFGLKEILHMIDKLSIKYLSSVVSIGLIIGIAVGSYLKGFYGSRFPFQNEEVRSSISFIKEYKRPADHVYIHAVSLYFFEYYSATGLITLPKDQVMVNKNNSEVEREVQKLLGSGKAYWLLFSHTDNGEAYVRRLEELHFRPTDKAEFPGSVVYRFDFILP